MPLVKEVCRRCVDSNLDPSWNETDEAAWESGVVFCPIMHNVIYHTNDVPDGCLFRLEQVVMRQEAKQCH